MDVLRFDIDRDKSSVFESVSMMGTGIVLDVGGERKLGSLRPSSAPLWSGEAERLPKSRCRKPSFFGGSTRTTGLREGPDPASGDGDLLRDLGEPELVSRGVETSVLV